MMSKGLTKAPNGTAAKTRESMDPNQICFPAPI